jgi:hypothetical protein
MPNASETKEKPPGRPRKRLTKSQLLPMTRSAQSEIALRYHLALALFRGAAGSTEQAQELFRAIYISYYLSEAGFGVGDASLHLAAEDALLAAVTAGERTDIWELDMSGRLAVERVLQVHEQQLANAPLHAVDKAHEQLLRFALDPKTSPWK